LRNDRPRTILVTAICGFCCASFSAIAEDNATQPDTNAESASSEYNYDDYYAEPQDTKPSPLSLEYFALDLQLEAQAERRTVRTDGQGFGLPNFAQNNRFYRIQETMGLQAGGEVGRERRWLRYDTEFRFGLSHERYVENSPAGNLETSPDSTLLQYDINLELFPAGKLSATAFASKLQDRIQRPFLPSLDRRAERYGIGLFYHDPKLPMQLTYEHTFDDLTSNSRFLLDDEERAEDTLRYELTWQPTQHHSLNLQYEYERRTEQYSGTRNTFNTERNYLILNHALQFGDQHRNRLDTIFRIEEESGDLPRDALEFAPSLRLQHNDHLFTSYRAQYLKQSFFNLDTDTLRGDWNITHQHDDGLTSTFGVYGLRQDTNLNADTTEWGVNANFAYTKENRLGRFSSSLSYLHSDTQTNDGGRGGVVTFESVTFRDPLPSQLAQLNVDLNSIVVWSANRTRVYIPGRDFLVLPIGGVTSLVRVRNGRIADRETVLVSYTYRTFNDFHVSRDRLDWRIQQQFDNGFDVYYALSLQDEDIDRSNFLVFQERNINRHRLGTVYRKERWSAGLELEYNDDSIDPFMAVHTNGDVSILQDAHHQLNARGTYSFFRFEGQDFFRPRQTNLVDVGLQYRYLFNQDLEANATASYRYESDTLFGETNGVDLTAGLAYKIGLFSVLLEVEYDALDLPSSTDNTAAVWLKFRRDIPIIGEARR